MAETITASLTVAGETITALLDTAARGPAGSDASVNNANVNAAIEADAEATRESLDLTSGNVPELAAEVLTAGTNVSAPRIDVDGSNGTGRFLASNVTELRDYEVPDASGTLALTSDITAASPIINVVKDHGADNTGATDCTEEVEEAVAAAEASTRTRTVYFPPGTYKFNVDLPEGVMVEGAGTALQADSPSSQHQTICIPADDDLPCFWIKYGTGQSISRIAFEGNGNGTSVCAIRQMTEAAHALGDVGGGGYGGMGVVMDHLFISGFTRGVELKNVNMDRFVNCAFTACGHGAYMLSTDTTSFDNCSFWDNDTLGLYANQPRGVVIRGGDHGTQTVPLFSFTNGGAVEICNIHVEGFTGSHVIEVGNTELNVHDCSWLDQSGVATTAWVRKTYFQFGVTIGRVFTSGVPAYTGTAYPLIFETEDSSCPPPDVVGMNGTVRWTTNNTYAADREVDTVARWGTPSRPRDVLKDEFIAGRVADGTIGELGWNIYQPTGAAATPVTRLDPAAPNIGQIKITTGTSLHNSLLLYTGGGYARFSNLLTSAQQVPWEAEFAVALPTGSTTSNIVHVGFLSGDPGIGGNLGKPPEFIGFTFNTDDSVNWRAYTRTGAVSSTIYDTGVAADTSRVVLRMRCIKAGEIRFSLNGGTEGVVTSGIPTGSLTAGCLVYTRTSAARELSIDYFRFQNLMTNR